MRRLFEQFMAKFTWGEESRAFGRVFNQSEVKRELIKALETARLNRQLSAAAWDDEFFADWDKLVVDLEDILRKNN